MNKSNSPWTLKLFGRGQKEVGNMNFVRDGVETVLGEKPGVASIVLPANSQFEVEFTHTGRAFYHCFELTAADGRCARFTADYPWPVLTLKTRPKVDLAPTVEKGSLPAKYLTSLAGVLTINEPIKGDLTILPEVPAPRDPAAAFEILNRTRDPRWVFSVEAAIGKSRADAGAALGTDERGIKVDFGLLGRMMVPASKGLKFWVAPGSNKTFNQMLRLSHPVHGEYLFVITNVPGKGYPEDLIINQVKGDPKKPWVYPHRFIFDGYLEIEDPDQELDFGIEES